MIDGGFSKPYQKVTGIAGYTLIYNSYGLNLTAHEPFTSKADAVARETDIVSNRVAVSYMSRRQLVGDTDTGHALKEKNTGIDPAAGCNTEQVYNQRKRKNKELKLQFA